MPEETVPVAIVGAGISGLSAAWSLRAAGRACVVLEAETRAGGSIRTGAEDGFLFEGGPDSFLAAKPEAVELCRALGLEQELIAPQPQPGGPRVWHRGRLRPIPPGWRMLAPARLAPVLRSPLFSPATKAAVALHWPRAAAPPREDESVLAYLERRFGRRAAREMAERVVQPLAAGVYGGQAAQLSAARLQPPARRPSAGGPIFLSLRPGMQTLVAALERPLGPQLRTGCRVRAIERRGEGYRLTLGDGAAETGAIIADALILATPVWKSAELLAGCDTALAEPLAAIPCASSVNINLAYRQAPPLPAGHGFLGGHGTMLACTFVHQKFSGRCPPGAALLRVFYGEADVSRDDGAIQAMACADLRATLGVTVEPAFVRIRRAVRALPQYTAGHASCLRRLDVALRPHPRLALAGNALGGVGVPDCIAAGRAAAARALAALS